MHAFYYWHVQFFIVVKFILPSAQCNPLRVLQVMFHCKTRFPWIAIIWATYLNLQVDVVKQLDSI